MSMNLSAPRYISENCRAAYQLHWAITLFASGEFPPVQTWLESVQPLLEADGIRILEQPLVSSDVIRLWVSTVPILAPSKILQRVKGRIQYAIRDAQPKAFRRNYRIESVGSAKRDTIDQYIAKQPEKHGEAEVVRHFQFHDLTVDLAQIRYSTHGQFLYNLHVVLEHADSWQASDNDFFQVTRQTIGRVCGDKGYLLSRVGIISNHLHTGLGCGIEDSPSNVAIGLLNELDEAHNLGLLYKASYYVGTFGNIDLGALRNARQGSP